MTRILYILFLCVAFVVRMQAQTNIYPSSGNVGLGITNPDANLHIRSPNSLFGTWLALDKYPNTETGIQFRKSSSVLFYLYSDNADNDALKIQSTGVPGEGDASPRIQVPFNSPNLFLVQSGGKVGVGTATPMHKLDVNGVIAVGGIRVVNTGDNPNDIYINSRVLRNESTVLADGMHLNLNSTGGAAAHLRFFANGTTERMRIDAGSGNVGIGVTTPLADARVHVKAPTASPWGIVAEANANQKIIGISHNGTAGFISTGSAGSDGASPIHFQTSGAVRMSILETGNVSIGTPLASNPNNYLLAVNGKVGAKEVRVEKTSTAWPDYVFEPGYNLPHLQAVEAFIAANKHLHDVPSAKEVESKGHDLGAMDAVLLKKIEELTLYVIELNKDLQEEKWTNERQRSEIETLKKQCRGRE